MKFFQRIVASLLLAAFSVFLVPNELVHALYGHEDTREQASGSKTESIDSQHIHCDFLTYEAPVYTSSSVITCPLSFQHSFAFVVTAQESAGIFLSLTPSPRGPPALV